MGYTHYFPGMAATAEVIADAKNITSASPVTNHLRPGTARGCRS